MSERWCPECEVTYRGIECPTCFYVHPDDEEALDGYGPDNTAAGHEHWED